MCGIVGFTRDHSTADPSVASSTLQNMMNALVHRGPDQQGQHITPAIALGHLRLSIISPTGGDQPRVDPHTGDTLIYNGEIYGHQRLRKNLPKDTIFRDDCDTETLFHLLQHYKIEDVLNQLNGMFAFAWYSAKTKTLTLARDAFGEKPIYYSQNSNSFIFASEPRALRAHPSATKQEPDWQALFLFLALEYLPAPLTGYDNIKALPAGHYLSVSLENTEHLSINRYFRFEKGQTHSPAHNYQDYIQQLNSTLELVINDQLIADRPIGIFLSGGVDSSLIAAIAKQQRENLDTFTIKFPYNSFDESQYASQVAKVLKTNHHTIEFTKADCLDAAESLLNQIDIPFADSSLLPTYLLCKAAKQQVTVALGGDGADELFYGYPNFKLAKLMPFIAKTPKALAPPIQTLLSLLPEKNGYMNKVFLLKQFAQGLGQPTYLQTIYWMAPISPTQLKKLSKDKYRFDTAEYLKGLCQDSGFQRSDTLESLQEYFINWYLASDILCKTDRAAMYNSLEVRSPMLDKRISTLASLKTMKHEKHSKHALKEILTQHLPKKIVYRTKHGFASPVSHLIRTDLKDLTQTILFEKQNPLHEFLDKSKLDKIWSNHQKHHQNNGKSLWSLICLSTFLQKAYKNF